MASAHCSRGTIHQLLVAWCCSRSAFVELACAFCPAARLALPQRVPAQRRHMFPALDTRDLWHTRHNTALPGMLLDLRLQGSAASLSPQ
jgi:hypothetical protein